MKKEFTKYNSLALKGIAIVMMFFHHNFRSEKVFSDYNISFFPLKESIVVDISSFFKICVAIFAFITGYGLAISLRKQDKKDIVKKTVNRVIRLILDFLIIAIIMYITKQIIDNAVYNRFFKDGNIFGGIVQIVIDLFGMNKLFGTASLDGNWWYMSFALLLIVTIPVIIKWFDKYGYTKVILAYMIIPRILHIDFVNSSYISFVFASMLGIICADKDLLVKWANKYNGTKRVFKFVLELVLLFVMFKIYTELPAKNVYELKYGIIPVAVIFFLYEFIIDIPVIKNILQFFGKYSMTMYFIHGGIREYCMNLAIPISNNFLFVTFVWFVIALVAAIILEGAKKLFKFERVYTVGERVLKNEKRKEIENIDKVRVANVNN